MLVTLMAADAHRDQVHVDRIGGVLVVVVDMQASHAQCPAELAWATLLVPNTSLLAATRANPVTFLLRLFILFAHGGNSMAKGDTSPG